VSQHQFRNGGAKRTVPARAIPLFAALLVVTMPNAAWSAASLFVTMAHSPAPAKEGTSLIIEFKVKNQGNAPSNGALVFKVSCANTLPQGPPCSFADTTKHLGGLQPGSEVSVGPFLTQPWKAGSFRFSTSIGARGGRPVVKAFNLGVSAVRTKGRTPSASRTAPAAVATAPATTAIKPSLSSKALKRLPAPDLTVHLDLPNNANDVLRATVRNVGTAASPATKVSVSCERKCDQFPWQACTGWPKEQPVPGLAKGGTKILVFNQQMPSWPMHYCWNKFSATVDPANQIGELNDSNNKDGGTVSGPDA